MRNSLIIFILCFFCSCGKNVNVNNRQLESFSNINSPEKANTDGVLIRGNPDVIQFASGSFRVSLYSSYKALEFVAAHPVGSQTQIRFKGITEQNEIKLEIIEAK